MAQLKVVYKDIDELKEYENNPRVISKKAIDVVANSIKEFGITNPILIDKDNVIVAGHTRVKACQQLGIKNVPTINLKDLTEEQIKAYRLVDNKTGEFTDWDLDLLDIELGDIVDLDMGDFGFDMQDFDLEREQEEWDNNKTGISLCERFGVPPFSVLDTRQGYWQDRRRFWLDMGLDAGTGRTEDLIGGGMSTLGRLAGSNLTGTSIFDPVVCEVCYRWFCPEEGIIIDPFAGGPPRGVVAHKLGYTYHGCDLREEQVLANQEVGHRLFDSQNEPNWYCGDSVHIRDIIPVDKGDLLFTCPPYFDLEKYSDDPRDISNMSYKDFIGTYRTILSESSKMIKDNRFAVIVVGEIRKPDGTYYNFVEDTKDIMRDVGFRFYNDIILLNSVGTASVRATKGFVNRKVTKIHQNVLVFYKGDTQKIHDEFGTLDLSNTEDSEETE